MRRVVVVDGTDRHAVSCLAPTTVNASVLSTSCCAGLVGDSVLDTQPLDD
jgi:hypothetical protein